MSRRLVGTMLICILGITSFSQDSTTQFLVEKFPSQYVETISKKSEQLGQKLDKKSEKALRQLQKQEDKILKKLVKIDSLAANNVFINAGEKYKLLEEKLKGAKKLTQYLPGLDTTITTLKFLEQNQQLLGEAKEVKEKLNDAFTKVKELESKLQKAEDIKQFLKERRQYLKEQLNKLGFAKELKKLNKEVYYYSQQVAEYKEILQDPKKIERKAIDLLSK